ncbi:efflux RND transporter periplasmic adaptor subunit [Acinetobacter shaoyimingii]|uniref:Efflux RND transporter periplasmic adaptor subunit n=1 Tax=Acinetobacter shaoyimingii TaxID=2715164 RepID=A0A6G8RXZ8_9GAMM|nr:efflux RND transporter periplasmic adaptor subunit [Acinetobacter shaoyimingii]QIO06678.1 efflux RND transporter periplasmic adaptor subunit [Acinetobacter shaoyimingii]
MPSLQQRVFGPFYTVKITTLCLTFSLFGCHQQEQQSTAPSTKTQPIELIQKDIIPVQTGAVRNKVSFSGTIRAVNQSSVQALVSATAIHVNVQVGQSVAKNQVLVELNNQDNASRLAQTQANLATAQAQAQQALNMVQRKKRLLDQGFISKVEYEQAQVEHKAQLENVKAQQANVNIATKANQDGVIRSPIQGVITKRQVEPGQTVAAGQTLFDVVDPTKLEIQAKLPAEQQAVLRVGNNIEYTIQGNPQKLSATIVRVSPIADLSSRQIEFFATPNSTINSLSIGTFVEGNILSTNQIQGQIVPLDLIQDLQSKPYLWVIRDKKVLQVFVKVLEQQLNDNTAVVEGLLPQDLISRIKFTNSDLNKPVHISAQ